MTRERLIAVAAVVLAAVLGYLGGSYSKPQHEERKEEAQIAVEEVATAATSADETTATTVDRTIVRRSRPATPPPPVVSGCPACPECPAILEETITEHAVSNLHIEKDTTAASATQTSASTTVTHEVDRSQPGWMVGVAPTWDPKALALTPDRLGLELDRRLAGTTWLGLRASMHNPSDPQWQLGAALRVAW